MKSRQLLGLACGAALLVFSPMVWGEADAHLDESHQQDDLGELLLRLQFDVSPGGTLLVDVPDGDIEVEPSGENHATVQVYVKARDPEWGREIFERMAFDVGGENNTVRVRARNARIRDWEWEDHRGVRVTVLVRVPEQFHADIRTSDGDVKLSELRGRVELQTDDGDVAIGRVDGPEISVRTQDGDIFANQLRADRIELHTNDGDVDVLSVEGALRISTGDGDISLELDQAKEVDLETGDGDITVYVEASIKADLDLSGEDVWVSRPFVVQGRVSEHRIRGTLNGGGPLITARTGDGTIRLRAK